MIDGKNAYDKHEDLRHERSARDLGYLKMGKSAPLSKSRSSKIASTQAASNFVPIGFFLTTIIVQLLSEYLPLWSADLPRFHKGHQRRSGNLQKLCDRGIVQPQF